MRLRIIAIIAALAVIPYCAGLIYLAYDLLHPWRMPLQAYQQDYLKNPDLYGISITQYGCGEGRIPCLMVSPQNMPGERGALLRKQLEASGIALQPYGKTQGILVLLHGRHGRKENLLPVAERFTAAGFNCVIPDLPGHGDNPENMSRFSVGENEKNIAADVLNDARQFFKEATAPAGLWGLSMGGAFASHAAVLNPQLWQVMVIVSSFDSLMGVIEDKFAAYSVPAPSLAKAVLSIFSKMLGEIDFNDVSPMTWAQKVKMPVLIVHGDQDKLIVIARGKRLYDSFEQSRDKRWLAVAGAGHNDILITTMPLYAEMSKWFLQHSQKN